ncbi:hypothetical protein [Serratia plymuthica]
MDGVTFKPRPRLIGVDHLQHLEKWESIGFYSEMEYNGWLQMNRLQNEMYEGYCVDVLHQKSGGEVVNE